MSPRSFRIRFLLMAAIACTMAGLAHADSAALPILPRDQYGVRLLHYSFTPSGDDTSIGLGSGSFQPLFDATGAIVGSTYLSDNCRKNDGSCPPQLSLTFLGPADAHGFRSARFVTDVHFRLAAGPGDVQVCSVEGCRTIAAATFQQQGSVEVTVPEITASIVVSLLTTPQSNVSWHFQIGDHVDFTPVAHADHPIVFIPGIAASELRDDHDVTVWPSLSPFLFSSTPLSLDPTDAAPPLHATDALRSISVASFIPPQDVYGEFLQTLAANRYPEYSLNDPTTHRFDASRLAANCTVDSPNPQPKLFVFPYDWRRPNAETAIKLAGYLQCVQKYWPGQKVDLVAHSMGGLVARRLVLTDAEARARVRQVVTVATPYLGAAKAIAVELNGSFMTGLGEILTAATFKKLSPFYAGVHELLPSRPAFPPSAPAGDPPPLRYFNYVPDVAGLDIVRAEYPTFVDLLDASFPLTHPGSVNSAFHDFPGQDSWRNDQTGVPVTQYFGTKSVSDTIVTATRYQRVALSRTNPGTYRAVHYDRTEYAFGVGDGTVPVGSARRPDSLLAPGAKPPIRLRGADGAMQHNRLPMTGASAIVALLGEETAAPAPTSVRLRADADDDAGGSPYLGTVESVYVSLLGSGPIVLSNGGQSFDSSVAGMQWMPGVSVEAESDDSWSLVLSQNRIYTVSFTATGKPFQIDLMQGLSNVQPRLAYRFLDVDLPAGTSVILQTVTLSGLPQLVYSGPGGSGMLWPTSISTPGQVDLTPPAVTISGRNLISIAATDGESGLWRIFYSTDGTSYRLYTEPFAIDPALVPTVYAFADDADGNRSPVVTYSPAPSVRATALTYRGPLAGMVGSPLTVAAALTDSTGSAPLAGQSITFQLGGETIPATTDANGVASAVYTPLHAGDAALTISFAGANGLAAANAAAILRVAKGVPNLTWSAPATMVYGTPLGAIQLSARADVPGTFAYLPPTGSIPSAGTVTLSVAFTPADGADYESVAATRTMTVLPALLTVAASSFTTTYGAALPPFTATLHGFVAGDTAACLTGALHFSSTVTSLTPPGTVPVTVSGLSSPNYAITFGTGLITVLPAPARVTFTGVRLAAAGGTTSGSTSLLLAATVDAATAGGRGDLRTATLTFVDRSRNTTLCTAAVEPAGLDGTEGVGACTATVGTAPGTLTVGAIVGGNYLRNAAADDAAVVIVPSSDRFLTGAGFLDATASSGTISADAGAKIHFTVEARARSGRPEIDGRLVIALQHTDASGARHAYEVALSRIGSFAATGDGARAVLTGAGATITDTTDPAHPAAVTSDALVKITVTQAGNGHSATVGMTVWKRGGGLWLANAWNGADTAEQLLGGGAVQIH